MRKALCVGIDSYKSARDLHGCVNDANGVKAVLERNGDGTGPDGINGQHTVAAVTQKPGEKRCGKNRDAPQQKGAENIKKRNAVLSFHRKNAPEITYDLV